MYVTPADLADIPGATELAQVATPEREPIVDADLMDATLRGTDRSAWTPDQQAAADQALAVINKAIADAGAMIEGFLAPRYTLPLDPVPSIVAVWATSITRYLLHKNRQSLEANDPIVRDYRDAQKFLAQVRAGSFSLGAGDPAPGVGSPQFRSGISRISECDLSDYGNG